MKSTELRMGNWLNGPEGNAQVTVIQNREVVEIGEIGHVMEDVSPIPLTEEWLIKFGFPLQAPYTDDDGISGTSRMLFDLNNGFLYSDSLAWCNHVNYKPIKYVHSLQNLYFALTGEELTIKE